MDNGIIPLPIHHLHTLRAASLPLHHRDPFDRLLVAQAQVETLKLMTVDRQLARYDVEILWADQDADPSQVVTARKETGQ